MDKIFKKSRCNFSSLEKYGFIKENNIYTYSNNFMDNQFKLILTIDKENIEFKVYDLNTKEEYTSFKIKDMNGPFVNKVKNEITKILNDIKNNCFIENSFIYDQANEISNYISKKYNDNPEKLWDKYPDYGIFRNKINNKWYAIIMNIDASKISNSRGEIEIINVKLNPDKIEKLLKEKGFYKAYHMNKKNWITIILDKTVKTEKICELIDESYNLSIK